MTNEQIILNASVKLVEEGTIKTTGRTISIKNASGEVIEIAEPEAIHTYAAWKQIGRQVKKGEKAKAQISIWKYSPKTEVMKMTEVATGKEVEQEVDMSKMFMKVAFFFTADQTEPIKA